MGKKNFFMWTVVILLFTAMDIFAEAEKGPKIVHEEEEITLLEGGKEVGKYYVGKISVQKQEVLKDVEEKKREVRVRDIQPRKLKFYDADGKLEKEIDLSITESRGRIKETRPLYIKGEFDVEMKTVKRPKVSKQCNYAVMDNTTYDSKDAATGKIILYDVTGKELFQKQFPRGRGISDHFAVSDNGTVAVITRESGEGPQGQDRLYVYDKSGKELLVYPKETESADITNIDISSNGKYIAIKASWYMESPKTVFFNAEKNRHWKADKIYVIYEISDEGIADASYYDRTKKARVVETIDIDKGL